MSGGGASVIDAAPASESAMDSLLLGRTQELQAVIVEGEKRNWKGIFIALLVITVMCSLIGLTVYYFNPQIANFGNQPKKDKITLKDLLHNEFAVAHFNGTWLTDNQLIYRDVNANILTLNVSSSPTASCSVKSSAKEEPQANGAGILLQPQVLADYYNFHQTVPGFFKQFLSPDRQYLMLVSHMSKVFRHSYRAIYTILSLSDFSRFQITTENVSKNELQFASWGRKDNDLVFVVDDNIYYKSCVTCKIIQITNTPSESSIVNGIPDWLYEEEILSKNNAIYFSPRGSKLAFASFNDSRVDTLSFPFYADESKILSLKYPKPGRNNPTVSLTVVDLNSVEKSKSMFAVIPPIEMVQRQDYYYTSAAWVDEENLLITWLTREQTLGSVSLCKANFTFDKSYTCKTIKQLTSDDGWVELFQDPVFSVDRKYLYMRLPSFQSENAGTFRHIAAIALDGSSEMKFITSGLFDTTNILKHVQFDQNNKYLYYLSTLPSNPGVNHLLRVKTDDNLNQFHPSTCLTCDLGDECKYNEVSFSAEGSYYVLECQGPGVPKILIRRTCPIDHQSEPSVVIASFDRVRELVANKAMPKIKEMSVPLEGGYNATVRLLLPPNLSENDVSRYPLLIHVYGGPGSQMVTSRFQVQWGHYLASSKNIIYGVIDGRGSANRGDKFLYSMYKKLGTVEVEDQIRVTRYLTEKLAYIRKDRVGIWGWSYGGYVAAMVLATDTSKPSVFSCGMSVAPVSDWLLYDSAYTERYMSLPRQNWVNYQKSSLLNKVRDMWGKKFLLIHGTADDNVHISQSMLLMKALTANNIMYSSQLYPDENHSLSSVTRHLYKTMEEFLNECFSLDVIYDDVGLRRAGSRRNRMD